MHVISAEEKNGSESVIHIPDESGVDVDVIDLTNLESEDVAQALNKIASVVDLTDATDCKGRGLAKEKQHEHQSPSKSPKSPSVVIINMTSPDRNGSPAERKSAVKNRLRKLLSIKKLAKQVEDERKSKKTSSMKASPVNQCTHHKPCTCGSATCIK